MFGRDKIAMIVAEFIGTFTLASVVLAMIGRTSFPFFAAVSAGAVVGLMTLIIGAASEAHLNPAVTIGLWWIRQVQAARAVVYIAAQMLGGLVALTLNEYLLNKSLPSIAGDKFEPRVLVAEALGTALFTFGIAAAVSQGHRGLKKAVTIGGSLSMGILLASFASNGLLNPAVALGTQSWSWAYAAGPVLGGLVGVSLYTLLFAPRPVQATKAAVAVTKAKATAAKKPAKRRTTAKRPNVKK
jgi:aquaporin Z